MHYSEDVKKLGSCSNSCLSQKLTKNDEGADGGDDDEYDDDGDGDDDEDNDDGEDDE